MMYCRGIRGATTVERDEPALIHEATKELLAEMVETNELHPEDIASVMISSTSDLISAFPAKAIRDMDGCWDLVPLMGTLEVPVPGALPLCIRILVHVNTTKAQAEIRHVYQRGAKALRPDLTQK